MDQQQPITADVIKQVLQSGEVPVEINGVHLVLMSLDARQELQKIVTDEDDDITGDDMLAIMAQQLDDPEGMGAPGMDDYDKKYGHLFATNGNDQ